MLTLKQHQAEESRLRGGFFEGAILFGGEWVTWEFYKDYHKIDEFGYIGNSISGVTVHNKKYTEYFNKELNSFLAESNLRTFNLAVQMMKEEIGEDENYMQFVVDKNVTGEMVENLIDYNSEVKIRNQERSRLRKICDGLINKEI